MADTRLPDPRRPHLPQPDQRWPDQRRPEAIIVAHGAPADPGPQEAALKALAVRVAMWLPGWHIRGATLAAPDALPAALAGTQAPLIYPFFMAEGWFTRSHLPKRLASAGAANHRQLPAFGTDAGVPALMGDVALAGARRAGLDPKASSLLIAAHGSQVSPASHDLTEALAATLRHRLDFARVITGYIEQAPYLSDVARDLGPALCLPFFALRAGHVAKDLPEALIGAGFCGPLLPALGEDARVARLIADALARAGSGHPAPHDSDTASGKTIHDAGA